MAIKWFKPKKQSGWKMTQAPTTRRSKLLNSTDKRKPLRRRYLEAGRRIQALANVTKSEATERKARADAQYFFKKVG